MIEVLIPAVGSLAIVLSKALVTDWNRFIFVVGPGHICKQYHHHGKKKPKCSYVVMTAWQ